MMKDITALAAVLQTKSEAEGASVLFYVGDPRVVYVTAECARSSTYSHR